MRTLVLLLLLPLVAPAQLPLGLQSGAINMAATASGQLILTTRVGEVAILPSFSGRWEMSQIGKGEKYMPGALLDQSNFFNNDTGIVSGFIQNGKSGNYNLIYRTTDKGRTWQPTEFGQSGWVDCAANLENGEAWLSVAGSGIAYTKDFGISWQKFDFPDKKQRFAQVYFNNQQQGLIGSLWNMLAYTNDNCKSWTVLKTPLDQNKYSKTNKESRPSIDKVAIMGNHLLVMQEGLIFYSRRDSIDWKFMPSYTNFFTDAYNSALYFKKRNSVYVRADQDLNEVFSYKLDLYSFASVCRSGNLYLLGQNAVAQLSNTNTLSKVSLLTDQQPNSTPIVFGYSNLKQFGHIGRKVYTMKFTSDSWTYEYEIPAELDGRTFALVDETTLLLTDSSDSLAYYHIKQGRTEWRNKKKLMEDFLKPGIDKIIFSRSSRGCFHSHESKLSYLNIGSDYEVGENSTHGRGSRILKQKTDAIDGTAIADFIKKLSADLNKGATIEDLQFTEDDYDRCRKDIRAFRDLLKKNKSRESSFTFYRNNIDFEKLLSMVDSVKVIDSRVLTACLSNLSDMYSTTSNDIALTLVNNKYESMTIRSVFFEPNAFYVPWTIHLNGYITVNTNVDITRFIDTYCPDLLENKNKIGVMHTLVKKLYDYYE